MAATRKRRQYTDAEIKAALELNNWNITKTARSLKVRTARVQLQATLAGKTAQTKRQDVLEAAKAAVINLADHFEHWNGRNPESLHRVGTAYGIAVDKLLLLAGKPISIQQTTNTDATVKVDITRLTRAELMELVKLHDRLNGVAEPVQVSDLANPVVYDETAPGGTPSEEKK